MLILQAAGDSNARSGAPDKADPVRTIQLLALSKICHRYRLDRALFSERLHFEYGLVHGTMRLFMQLAAFFLMFMALQMTSHNWSARLIVSDLTQTFNLNGLAGVGTAMQFSTETLPAVASMSKSFFSLSNTYFDTGESGAIQMIDDFTEFSAPRVLAGADLGVDLPQWTMTTWIKFGFSSKGGYIIRKRPQEDSALSCWAWHVDRRLGQSLRYGAHDYFPNPGPLPLLSRLVLRLHALLAVVLCFLSHLLSAQSATPPPCCISRD